MSTPLRAIETARGPGRVVTNVSFEPGGLTVEFVAADDVKANGVMRAQSVFVPHGNQYDDEIDTVVDAAKALVADVLEDLPRMEVKDFEGADTETGMGQ